MPEIGYSLDQRSVAAEKQQKDAGLITFGK
jgi:hypothetical protein